MTFRSTLTALAAAAALTAFAAPGLALAGPQYIDSTGFAASGYDVVAYRSLPQAGVGQAQPEPVLGSTAYVSEWNGSKWAFASAENKAAFDANPAFYAPAYDGHCAYGVAQGGKVPGSPLLWRIVDDVLYLNVNKAVVGFWESDIPGNVTKSEKNWPGIEGAAASTKPIPAFTAPGPQS